MSAEDCPTVLILTPVKNAAPFLAGYVDRLERLSYPPQQLSLGMIESDSVDGTFAEAKSCLSRLDGRLAEVGLWKRDYNFRPPQSLPRWWGPIQRKRRRALARSRNHLLSRALHDQAWVLWIDVDVVEFPRDVIERLLATGKRIVQPNCVIEYGGPSFDQNAWKGPDKAFLSDLRGKGDLVALDSVGGTMLLIDADLHRDGLVFPSYPYRPSDGLPLPKDVLAMETEGLGLMARDMGETCWGLPDLEIRHHPA